MADRNERLTLGGLDLTTRAIRCFDYAELFQSPAHRGGDFTVPGVAGDLAVDREAGPLFAQLTIRIDGKWTHDTDVSSGSTPAAWRAEAYTSWQLLHDIAEDTTTQTLTLADTDASFSSSKACQTLSLAVDRRESPHLWVCSLDVKLPGGTMF